MDHEKFVEAMASSMSTRQDQIRPSMEIPSETPDPQANELQKTFEVVIPMVSGCMPDGCNYRIDTRDYRWDLMATPENKEGLKTNQAMVRSIVASLVTLDFSDPKAEEVINMCDDALESLFKGFGINPNYDVLTKNMMVKPYILLFAKCVDALAILNTAEICIARYELSKERFDEISETIKNVANLNDITEMDNSLDGLLTEDRINYGGIPDDHDVSGLLEEL